MDVCNSVWIRMDAFSRVDGVEKVYLLELYLTFGAVEYQALSLSSFHQSNEVFIMLLFGATESFHVIINANTTTHLACDEIHIVAPTDFRQSRLGLPTNPLVSPDKQLSR